MSFDIWEKELLKKWCGEGDSNSRTTKDPVPHLTLVLRN